MNKSKTQSIPSISPVAEGNKENSESAIKTASSLSDTPFMRYVENICSTGNLDVLVALLTSDKTKERILNNKDYSKLCAQASGNGHFDIVRYLLVSPELPIRPDLSYSKSLGYRMACHKGHVKIVDCLLMASNVTKPCDIHACMDWGLRNSAALGHKETVEYLINKTDAYPVEYLLKNRESISMRTVYSKDREFIPFERMIEMACQKEECMLFSAIIKEKTPDANPGISKYRL